MRDDTVTGESRFPRVIVIGGAPMTGKSTLARRLAAREGYAWLSTDDIGQAVRAVTAADTHPSFHYMDGSDYREYYIATPIEQLISDAVHYCRAMQPALAAMIAAHLAWGSPIVIEGWACLPRSLAALRSTGMTAAWLVAGPGVLEQRVRANVDFYRGASDEEAMIRQFIARSAWIDARIRREAHELALTTVPVEVDDTPGMLERRIVEGC